MLQSGKFAKFRCSSAEYLFMQTATALCPHCGADNPIAAAFCNVCGKPLVVGGVENLSPTTRADLEKKARTLASRSSAALLSVFVLQVIFSVVPELFGGSQSPLPLDLAIAVAIAMLACFLWSRVNPFNAALTAAAIFVGRHLIHAAIDPSALRDVIAFKLIVAAVLGKAIYDAYRHKELKAQISKIPPQPIDHEKSLI